MTLYVDPLIGGHVNNGGQDEQYGLDGDDTLLPLTVDQAYSLYGGSGDDGLIAQNFGDYLEGGSGNDGLFAGGGNDHLYGGNGNDIVQGDSGRDILFGGLGADTFRYFETIDSPPGVAARDDIRDFAKLEGDRIDLSNIDARSDRPDDQAFKFIGNHDFHHKAGELQFHNGKVFADVDGDGHKDFAIRMVGIDSMQASDFVL